MIRLFLKSIVMIGLTGLVLPSTKVFALDFYVCVHSHWNFIFHW